MNEKNCSGVLLRTARSGLPPGRKDRAHTAIELGASAFVLAVLAIFCADIGVLLYGANVNDRACRDAARAAAQTSSQQAALAAAEASLSAYAVDGYYLKDLILDYDSFVYEDFGGSAPPDQSPFVVVSTSLTAKIPAPVLFFGASFGKDGEHNFSRTYTFPIVKTQLML